MTHDAGTEAELIALRKSTVDHWLSVALGDEGTSPRLMDKRAVEQELEAMRSSISWRVTAPLRVIRRRF